MSTAKTITGALAIAAAVYVTDMKLDDVALDKRYDEATKTSVENRTETLKYNPQLYIAGGDTLLVTVENITQDTVLFMGTMQSDSTCLPVVKMQMVRAEPPCDTCKSDEPKEIDGEIEEIP